MEKSSNKIEISLGRSDKIKDDKKNPIKYGVYGYPHGKYTKWAIDELWGMSAPSISQKNGMYVRRDDKRIEYNAIDTESGMSGSAIWIKLKNGTYKIIGSHTHGFFVVPKGKEAKHRDHIREVETGQKQEENGGVALNEAKMKWIKQNGWNKSK